jgi:3-oxoacid CoA-transferase subunit A/glutaconate CoA-transferase subunit A
MDVEAAKASRHVIITTEEIIEHDKIRSEPWRTTIPFYYVDAVVEAPWGAHPSNMPYLYYIDEEFLNEWLEAAKSIEGVENFLDKYVYSVDSLEDYLKRIGGFKKIAHLMKLERL